MPKPSDKKGKNWRLVVDYRYLNSQTKYYPFPLLIIEDLIAKQTINKLWSIFDLEDGFHQMHLHPDSYECTAFVTSKGVYHWTVLPMGVKNGPSMFQAMITWVIRDLPNVIVYIDDLLIGSTTTDDNLDIMENHYKDTNDTLERLQTHKLFVKGVKMHLFKPEIKFCGHLLKKTAHAMQHQVNWMR